ncbi:MAG: hypothetical protein U0168_16410 [Nannocystaceae bacterium]
MTSISTKPTFDRFSTANTVASLRPSGAKVGGWVSGPAPGRVDGAGPPRGGG